MPRSAHTLPSGLFYAISVFMTERQKLGNWCELQAAELLLSQGLRILARNYRWKGGEIDLIGEESRADGRVELVFVEVRARDQVKSGSWTSGLESVTFPKRLRLSRTASRYLAQYRGRARYVRCDVISWDGKALHHFRNAWNL